MSYRNSVNPILVCQQQAGFLLAELVVNTSIASIVLLSVVTLYSLVYQIWLRQIALAHLQEDIRATYFVIREQLKHLPLQLVVQHHQLYYYRHRWTPLAKHAEAVEVLYGLCHSKQCDFVAEHQLTGRENISLVKVNIRWQVTPHQCQTTRWYYAP